MAVDFKKGSELSGPTGLDNSLGANLPTGDSGMIEAQRRALGGATSVAPFPVSSNSGVLSGGLFNGGGVNLPGNPPTVPGGGGGDNPPSGDPGDGFYPPPPSPKPIVTTGVEVTEIPLQHSQPVATERQTVVFQSVKTITAYDWLPVKVRPIDFGGVSTSSSGGDISVSTEVQESQGFQKMAFYVPGNLQPAAVIRQPQSLATQQSWILRDPPMQKASQPVLHLNLSPPPQEAQPNSDGFALQIQFHLGTQQGRLKHTR